MKLMIKEFREKYNLSQTELAKLSGISRSYLNEIEHNIKTPSLQVIERIGNALKIDPHKLITFDITYRKRRKSNSKSTLK